MPSTNDYLSALQSHGRIGDWRLRDFIGNGAFGFVFLGERQRVDGHTERAAVKVLLPGNLGDEALFVHEFNVLRKVENQYIVKLLGSGIEKLQVGSVKEQIRWFAMEEIRGQNLAKDIEEHGLLDKQEWLELAHDLLTAVAHLHGAGIIHKDIKPENIMRSSRRSILADLGASSFVGISDPGDLPIATIRFAAPEQLNGTVEPEDLSYEADLFAVANTLAYVATGVTPWDLPNKAREENGRFVSVTEQILRNMDTQAPRLSGLDADQLAIIEPMLSMNPIRRGTALAALEQIKSLLPESSSRRTGTQDSAPLRPVPQNVARGIGVGSIGKIRATPKLHHGNFSSRPWLVTLLLAIFLGWLGAHRFYVGKTGTGILYAMSVGGFYVGWLIDIILILTKNFKDNEGKVVAA